MDKQKGEVYRFKLKDFIPFYGLDKYVDRCARQTAIREIIYGEEDSREYFNNGFGRGTLLALYNAAILFGAFVGAIKGLDSILSK